MTDPQTNQPPSSTEAMRKAFEAWYCADAQRQGLLVGPGITHLREGDHYGEHRISLNSKWEGWQAAQASAAARQTDADLSAAKRKAIQECFAVLQPCVKGKFPQEQALAELLQHVIELAEGGELEAATHGCNIDLEPGEYDACVLDTGAIQDCVYAVKYGANAKQHCGEWKPIKVVKKTEAPNRSPVPLADAEILATFASCHVGFAYPQDAVSGPRAMRLTEGRAIEALVRQKNP